jgi:transcriptional regulator with XRE-family HTH domain
MEIPEASDEVRRGRYGDRLRRAREALGLTQREVAERVGVDQKVVSRAESGHASEEAFVALEEVYGLSEPLPGAPKDPVRRMVWVRERQAAISGPRAPVSGSFGSGQAPRGAS